MRAPWPVEFRRVLAPWRHRQLPRESSAGTSIFSTGDKGQGRKRVASLAPGLVFGEMATRLRYANPELREASA